MLRRNIGVFIVFLVQKKWKRNELYKCNRENVRDVSIFDSRKKCFMNFAKVNSDVGPRNVILEN